MSREKNLQFLAKYNYYQTVQKNPVNRVFYSSHLQRTFGSGCNSGYYDVLVALFMLHNAEALKVLQLLNLSRDKLQTF